MTSEQHSYELSDLLNKQHIIPTISAAQLRKNPSDVEHGYLVHAKTHVPLGDTEQTVKNAFKWLSGENKGALIGGVTGDYGEGKTSFLIHTWAELSRRGSLVTPPFSWRSVAEVINGTHGWVMHKLKEEHPDQAQKAQALWDTYREKTLEEQARKVADETGQPFETVFDILRQSETRLDVGVETLLDYLEALAPVVDEAGFEGLLVSLDEAELAARGGRASTAEVATMLFEMANGLINRSGNYGIFVSIPDNFMAQLRAAFASLPPRLEYRRCFVTLASLYNDDFASTLWNRYARVLDFTDEASSIIPDVTLNALGQMTSSERRDLTYGPRTVITAFRRAVELYTSNGHAYSPLQLMRDTLSQDVTVRDTYSTAVSQLLHSRVATELGEDEILCLAAFPNGVHIELLKAMGIDNESVDAVARPGHPQLWRRNNIVGFLKLQRSDGLDRQNFLEEQIVDVATRFAPRPRVFSAALEAFESNVLPILLPKRRGQAITGWRYGDTTQLASDTHAVPLVGTFEHTSSFPERNVEVVFGPHDIDPKELLLRYEPGSEPDILFVLRLWWQADVPMPDETLAVDAGDAAERIPSTVCLDLDIGGLLIENEHLANATGDPEQLTPLFILNLTNEIEHLTLPKNDEAVWTTVRDAAIRRVATALIGDDLLREAAEAITGEDIPGDPLDLLPSVTRWILDSRHPSYETLIVQPSWATKVRTYLNLIKNSDIPASAKRGLEAWKPSKNEAERAFNANLMNITGGWGAGLESLLKIDRGDARQTIEVSFRLHPLEKEIQNLILHQAEGDRIEIDGVVCWWMPLKDVASHIFASGYREEELKLLIEIGRARGTFDIAQIRSGSVLYCRPFDPEQKRTMLREHAAPLRNRESALESLPRYQPSPLLANLDKEIEGVEDDESFERLKSAIDHALANQKLALDGAQSALQTSSQEAVDAIKRVQATARQMQSRELPAELTSSVTWGSSLLQFGLRPLRHEARELEQACTSFETVLTQLTSTGLKDKSGSFEQVAARLDDARRKVENAKREAELMERRIGALSLRVVDFSEWIRLLRQVAEPLQKKLFDLQEEEANRETASQFLSDFTALSDSIEGHLATHQQSGLGSHAHFSQNYADLEKRVDDFFRDQQKRFNDAKVAINEILQQAAITNRASETYNPMDVSGCYDRLYSQAAECILDAVQEESTALNRLKLEVLYASDVLGAIPKERAETLINDLVASLTSLANYDREAAIQLVRTEDAAKATVDAKGLGEAIRSSAKTQHSIRQKLKSDSVVEDGMLSGGATRLLELLQDEQDLKALVLALIEEGEASDEALEFALTSLTELFRAGKINLRAELPRR